MINIRKAFFCEHNLIAEFQQKMALETEKINLDADTVIKGVKAVFFDNQKGRYYVAECEGKVVASMLTTYEWSDWRNGTVIWLQSVYVLESFRGKGVFRQMYHHIKQMVEKNSDFKGIRLYVDISNTNACKVYESLGMNGSHYATYEDMKH